MRVVRHQPQRQWPAALAMLAAAAAMLICAGCAGAASSGAGATGTGSQQRAIVVAFSLGSCHGKRMYRAVEWYFPQHGQSFSASHYQDICHGSYVPAG